MTRPRRRSKFRSAAPASGTARALLAALALAAGAAAFPRAAAGQACCVGTGLVTPARLRTFEDRAVGVQMRARSVMGAFGGSGSYAASGVGNRELGFEEDLFGALRLGSHFQVAVWAPFVQTSRAAGGLSFVKTPRRATPCHRRFRLSRRGRPQTEPPRPERRLPIASSIPQRDRSQTRHSPLGTRLRRRRSAGRWHGHPSP